MVQTDNEFQMLMARLDRLDEGQRSIQADLQKLHGSDATIRERLAALESKQERYVTFKMLVMTGGSAVVGGAGLGGGIMHLVGRLAG